MAAAFLLASMLLCSACGGGGASAITIGAVAAPGASGTDAFHAPAGAVTRRVGPGAVRAHLVRVGYRISIAVSPNRASRPNLVAVTVARAGHAVAAARVHAEAGMLGMAMGVASYDLRGSAAYRVRMPAWLMPGEWGLALTITPPGRPPIRVVLDDRMLR
jgi:hypothetical protein